ncbi:putative Longin domain-containing protein [Helianthus annuus]|nr:putative Longin domain-containing protein [Helianthus annuus]
MVRNGVCFITLCDVSYPRKLAFHYLQDLQKEFDKVDPTRNGHVRGVGRVLKSALGHRNGHVRGVGRVVKNVTHEISTSYPPPRQQ